MSVINRLSTAEKPNGSTYAVPFRKVYVSDTLGKAVAIVNKLYFNTTVVRQTKAVGLFQGLLNGKKKK